VFKLPALPYAYEALEPTISAETMRLHHDKHHAKYIETINKLAEADGLTATSLEEMIGRAEGKLLNNALQAWNHAFFWSCMTARKAGPDSRLAEMIGTTFGGQDELKARFVKEGEGHFGSGWVWLLASGDRLDVRSTHDGANLLGESGVVPLIVCDLWEHAYYVDYRNDRKAYLEAWFDALPDWEFAGHQLDAGHGQGELWRFAAAEEEPQRRHG
jgi:Fe-Mn family superoxide dismutase